MTRFESKIASIKASEEKVFEVLSDLNNLERFKGNIPESENIKDIVCDTDSCQLTVNPVGKIGLRIIERTPFSTIKLQSEQSPVKFLMWIQLKELGENDTRLKITLDADLNPILKGMVGGVLQKFIDMMVDQLGNLSFGE